MLGVTLDDVLARESIRDLVTRYNSYGDAGRFDQLWPLFADDAQMEIRNPPDAPVTHSGIEAIKGIFTGAQDRVREQLAASRPAYVRHSTSTHQIDLIDGEHATGRCYYSVIGPDGLDHWGRYIDRYRKVGARWCFEHRLVTVDGRNEASWFAGQ